LADQLPTFSAPLEARIFKDACTSIIDEISKTMGWGKYAGTTGNLSGKEGDMDEITTLVQQIHFDWEKKKEETDALPKLEEEKQKQTAKKLEQEEAEKARKSKASAS
jgi:hypothetical protein